MAGGKGNDYYLVDSAGDKVIEAPMRRDDGRRRSLPSFTLGANSRTWSCGGAINGTGNSLANEITGNALANKLDGGAGNDVRRGRQRLLLGGLATTP